MMYHDPSGRYEQEYSDDFTTESGQSRTEQMDGEVGNVAGGMEYEGDIVTLSGQWKYERFFEGLSKADNWSRRNGMVQNGVKYDGLKDGVLLDAKGN